MDPDGMGVTPEYAWTVVALSVVGTALAVVYAIRIARAYRTWHDERAAVSLAKAVGLVVVAVGLLVSASGLVVGSASFSIAGLAVARGAFLVLITSLVLADVRPDHEEAP